MSYNILYLHACVSSWPEGERRAHRVRSDDVRDAAALDRCPTERRTLEQRSHIRAQSPRRRMQVHRSRLYFLLVCHPLLLTVCRLIFNKSLEYLIYASISPILNNIL